VWFSPAPLLVIGHIGVVGGSLAAFRSRRRRFGRFLASRHSRG